jgi:hypothetical protein
MHKLAFTLAASLIAASAAAAEQQTGHVLTVEGLGSVRIGMTVAEAEKALGAKLNIQYFEEGDRMSCGTGARADGKSGDVSYMVMKGRIVRIAVMRVEDGSPSIPVVRTIKGIGLGASEAQVKSAYGGLVKVEPHPYGTENDHYLIVDTPDRKRGLIFETEEGRVSSFRAGVYPEVGYIEGCA